jgi:hypothetical protein
VLLLYYFENKKPIVRFEQWALSMLDVLTVCLARRSSQVVKRPCPMDPKGHGTIHRANGFTKLAHVIFIIAHSSPGNQQGILLK